MSLLSIVNDFRLRKNMSAVASVIGSSDTGVLQMTALLQDIGDELAERNWWATLNINGTIVADGVTVLFPFPTALVGIPASDFAGMSAGLTFQSTLFPTLPVPGPVTNEEMNAFKAYPVAPLNPIWREINGQFEFFPAPALGEVYTYNYYSPRWIFSGGSRALRWAADTDVSLIDEKILTSGLEWRWLETKGLDYAEAFRRYEMRLSLADGRQDTSREVRTSNRMIGIANSWPGLIPLYDGSDTDSADFSYS
jgi:hypothetical protein